MRTRGHRTTGNENLCDSSSYGWSDGCESIKRLFASTPNVKKHQRRSETSRPKSDERSRRSPRVTAERQQKTILWGNTRIWTTEIPMNIFYLTAIVIFFTSAHTAPAGNKYAIQGMIDKLNHRANSYFRLELHLELNNMQKVISDEVRQIVSEPAAGIRYEAIFQRLEPSDGKYVGDAEVRLMRAYHACVFERLKFLFLSLQESPGVPQEMLDIVYTELSIHFRLANEFTEVCRYRTRMTKLDMPRQYSTGGNDNSHTIGHVEPCLLHPDYAEKYEQASRIIGRRLDEFIKGIISCIKYLQNARAESEDNRIVRQDASRDRERFPIYESTDDWGSLWTYEELNKLPLSNRPWLPLRAAHERLIIERVRFDIEHLYLLPDSAEATRRLRPFSKFLQDHQRKLEELEKLLLSDGTLDRGVSIEHQRPEIPVFGNSLDAVKNLTPATVRPHQHPVEASPPPKVPYMGVYTPWDETYVLGREARDDAETSSSKPPK
ncbi:hypothetical protein SeLEV6574_g08490, partial [Synchytrium endobioticum]